MNPDTQACDRCHRRKTRCDKLRPECGPCAKAAASCVYTERIKEPVYRRDFVEKLERRLRQLEVTNRALKERLAATRQERLRLGLSPASTSGSIAEEAGDHNSSNEVANEVSFLSTSAGGDRQFLGSASGFLFASLVRASVATPSERDPDATSSALLSTRRPGNTAPGKPDWAIDDRALPPQQLARSLVEAYLAHDHLCYPYLHPQSVRAVVDSIYNDTSFYSKHPFEAFMFNMLLAIATSQVHKFNWQALPDAETHHLRAMVHLNAVLCEGGLKALQSMLLLCQFRLSSSTQDASGSLWHIAGISARMCFELGLHRESSYRLKSNGQESTAAVGSISRFEEQEVRRRCFWCVFALDRIVSITLGRPLAISLKDIDVELPVAELADASSPSTMSPGDEQDLSRIAPRYRTALFVHIMRYRTLCGRVLTSLHRGCRSAAKPEPDLPRVRRELAAELESWRADTSSLNLPEMDLSTPIAEARSSFRSKAWYELLYHNGVLLLYRPSSTTVSTSDDDSSLQRVFSSAKQSITLYAYLFRSRKINFSWITLHAVFMAGLSYVYAVSRHFRRKHQVCQSENPRAQLAQDPTIFEIVNDCRACSNVLVAVSERCNAQKNCHEVFDRLSDAVLADAVELLSASARRGEQNRAPAPSTTLYTPTQRVPTTQALNPGASPTIRESFHISLDQQLPNENNAQLADTGFIDSHMDNQPVFTGALLAADNALRDCFPDLQRMYDGQWGDDAILQLSTDWLGEIHPGNGLPTGEAMEATFL